MAPKPKPPTQSRPSPPSFGAGPPPSEATESEVSVPPPTATTQLPMTPVIRPHMRRPRACSASSSITFERIYSDPEPSSPSSSTVSYSRVCEEVAETIIPRFGKKMPQAPELPEPSRTSTEEIDQDIDFVQELKEIHKRKEPSSGGAYIPPMLQLPAQPILPDWVTQRNDDTTPRPPSPPKDLGQGPSCRSPTFDPWYARPQPLPAEKQANKVGWAPQPGITIVPPSQVLDKPQFPYPRLDRDDSRSMWRSLPAILAPPDRRFALRTEFGNASMASHHVHLSLVPGPDSPSRLSLP